MIRVPHYTWNCKGCYCYTNYANSKPHNYRVVQIMDYKLFTILNWYKQYYKTIERVTDDCYREKYNINLEKHDNELYMY